MDLAQSEWIFWYWLGGKEIFRPNDIHKYASGAFLAQYCLADLEHYLGTEGRLCIMILIVLSRVKGSGVEGNVLAITAEWSMEGE